MSMSWHVSEAQARAYRERSLVPPQVWSVDTHLVRCAACRDLVTRELDPAVTNRGWARLAAELDVPREPVTARLLVRLGVPEHTSRLLAATPVLRRSWLLATALTVAFCVAFGHLAQSLPGPPLLLAVAPVLPLIGVAVSFGPGVDPTYEMSLVAPVSMFRLLLLRSTVVLATTAAFGTVGSVVSPEPTLATFAWVLPALALTLLNLALMSTCGPLRSATISIGLWIGLVLLTTVTPSGDAVLAAVPGQIAAVGVGGVSLILLVLARARFETDRLTRVPHSAR